MGFAKRMAKLCLVCDNIMSMDDYDLDDDDDDSNMASILDGYGSQRVLPRSRGRTPRTSTGLNRRSRSASKGRTRKARGSSAPQKSSRNRNTDEGLHKEDNFFFGTIEMDSDITVGSSLSGSTLEQVSQKSNHSLGKRGLQNTPMKMPSSGTKASVETDPGDKYPTNTSSLDNAQKEGLKAEPDAAYYHQIGSLIASSIDQKLKSSIFGSDEASNQGKLRYKYKRASTEPIPILKSPKSVTFEDEEEIESYGSHRVSLRSERAQSEQSNASVQANVSLLKPHPRDTSSRQPSFQKVRSGPASALRRNVFKGSQPSPVKILSPSPRASSKVTPRSKTDGWKLTNRRAMKPKGSQSSNKRIPQQTPSNFHVTLHMK